MNGLSIIIPVYQKSKNLNKLIHLINKSLIIKKFEIIIIDDDSSNESHEILKNKRCFYKI
jgi:glycosyltransferase involved in cell wall biosynthesis